MQAVAYHIYRHTVNESIRQSDKFIILGTDEWNTIQLIQLLMFYVHSVVKSLIGKFRKLFARVYDCGFMKMSYFSWIYEDERCLKTCASR